MAEQDPAGTFTVLGRQWCHLCDDLVAQLQPIAQELGWKIDIKDVDVDPLLEARWDELVPVLLVGDCEICHYHLDEARVRAFCAQHMLGSKS